MSHRRTSTFGLGGGGGGEGGDLIARTNYIMLESASCTYALESQLKQKRSQFSRLMKLLSFRFLITSFPGPFPGLGKGPGNEVGFLEPPRETKIAFKNQIVREIGG